jgi:ribonuclease Z
MATLHLLGTGAPASDPHRTTTMLAFSSQDRAVIVDCGGDVLQRALSAGMRPDQIDALILTHEHPDHVGGFALFVEKMWLYGRTDPIPVYGPETALRQARGNFASYNTNQWEGVPELRWHAVPLEEGVRFLDLNGLSFSSSPTDHGVPCIALRIDNQSTGRSVCYSADTNPCDAVVRLGTGCEIMVHEASGDNPVHSTVDEAADIAQRAGSSKLILVHLPAGIKDRDLENARRQIPDTSLAEELGSVSF